MKNFNLTHFAHKTLLIAIALLGLIVVSSTAQAQFRHHGHHGQYGWRNNQNPNYSSSSYNYSDNYPYYIPRHHKHINLHDSRLLSQPNLRHHPHSHHG